MFASLLEYAAIGYLMKRNRSVANPTPVQYYETGDGVLKREASTKKKKKRNDVKVGLYFFFYRRDNRFRSKWKWIRTTWTRGSPS